MAANKWWTDHDDSTRPTPLFRDLESVYGAGQFTWAGLWTVTAPPPEVHEELIAAWEFFCGAVTRWSLPAGPQARVFEIHRPADWVRLVTEHPRVALSHPGWELPGINQHPGDLASLLTVSGQHAARTSIRHHLVPDWRGVADHYDGVHLSWAGFITAEGCITDLDHGDVAMLRYWSSERTHWLTDVFTEPQPATDPAVRDPATGAVRTTSTVTSSARRRRTDIESIRRLLGR